jgi:A/G-specific adenine glycosylase
MLGLPTTAWRDASWTRSDALAEAPAAVAWREIGVVRHVFTHFSLDLSVFQAKQDSVRPDFIWTPLATASAATPSLFRKALALASGRYDPPSG